MKNSKKLKKIANKNNKNTFDAIVDIVSYPENIQYYSHEREDYTELALNAIRNNEETVQYVSPLCKDYAYLCEEAVSHDMFTFFMIDDNVSNYKELGIKSIASFPFFVRNLKKNQKYYHSFWRFAISQCYKVLSYIDESRKELFGLIAETLDNEPHAILYVDSNISVYNNLCRFAYSKDSSSATYMCVNKVDESLALKIIGLYPEKLSDLNSDKPFYKKACKIAVSLYGEAFKFVDVVSLSDDLEFLFELIEIAKQTYPSIVEHSNVFYVLCKENEKKQQDYFKTNPKPNEEFMDKSVKLNNEYIYLSKRYKEACKIENEMSRLAKTNSSVHECPFKTRTR